MNQNNMEIPKVLDGVASSLFTLGIIGGVGLFAATQSLQC